MNAKKLLSTLLSAAMAVSMLAGCFGGGGNKNYSDKAADAANAAQSTVVFATDAKLSKSLQDALENFTQLDDIKDAMEADENLKSLLTSGYDLDVVAEQGEDAEAAAKAIAEKYILSIVSGKKAEGKIAMVLHDGNGYYYVAVLTYGSGGSGSGGGAGGGSGSGDGDHPGGNPGGGTDPDDPNKPVTGDDDDEEENGPVAQSIEVTKDPDKRKYFLNDYFNPTGMEVTLHTNQGERVLARNEYTIVKEAFSETGEQKVTIIYYDQETGKELYAYVTVNVSAPEVTSIEVTKTPTKTHYLVGEETEETFDPAGMEVTAYFDDGSWRVLAPSEYTVDKGPFSNVGDNEVKITYNDASTSVTVTGVKFVETSVTYSDTPSLGDSFDEGLLTVIAVYDDGIKNVEKEVKKFTYDIDDINADGQFTDTYVTVEVSYTDEFGVNRTGSGDIEVAHVAPVATGSLRVTPKNSNKTYTVGDNVLNADLKVEIEYKDALGDISYKEITNFEITSNPLETAGDKVTVTVEATQDGKTLTGSTTVTVAKKEHQVTIDRTGDFSKYATLSFEGSGVPFTTVKDGGTYTFRFKKTDNSQKVSGIVVDGTAGKATFTSKGDIYTVTVPNIKSDITITVKFESVQPEIARIEVTQAKDIYVGQTLTSEYLTVTAYDASGNKIANPGLTFTKSTITTFDFDDTYRPVITYTDKTGKSYQDTSVEIKVSYPSFTLITNDSEPFKNGDTFFFYKEHVGGNGAHEGQTKEFFRDNMVLRITFAESKEITITKDMVTGNKIQVMYYTDPYNDIRTPTSFEGFDMPGDWTVTLAYKYGDGSNTYQFDYVVKIP